MTETEPTIEWLGHASFRIESKGMVIYIDPWQTATDRRGDLILITHDHHDHCSPDDVARLRSKDTIIVAPPSAAAKLPGPVRTIRPGERLALKGIEIEATPAYNLNKFRSPGVPFHSREAGNVGYVATLDGMRIYHSGDSDVIPEMSSIHADIALLPVSGIYVMTADEAVRAAELIKPKKVIPMHVGRGIGTLDDRDSFRQNASVPVIILPLVK
ncbi:MAG: MBL fold metallo-hydrolase [Deltaproteobacteria bacterium]|nr:MBL fold metallo-hydrolase [Deltaproteobacteria bacterium]